MTRLSREERLTDAFVQLADSMVNDYDVVGLLHNLIDYCVDLLDVTAAGLVLRDAGGGLEVLASSSEESRLLELLQVQEGQGPCVECYASGRVVNIDDLTVGATWPRFRADAIQHGIRSVHAVPMRLREQTIGALNLFSAVAGPFPRADAKVAQALTDVATIAILQERSLRQTTVVNEQLQNALHSRVLIEQAKGVLAEQTHLDMDGAFRLLRGYARSHNRRLRDVATAVIDGSLDLPAGAADSRKPSKPTR